MVSVTVSQVIFLLLITCLNNVVQNRQKCVTFKILFYALDRVGSGKWNMNYIFLLILQILFAHVQQKVDIRYKSKQWLSKLSNCGGGRAHFHIFMFCTTNFFWNRLLCKHRYMNIPPPPPPPQLSRSWRGSYEYPLTFVPLFCSTGETGMNPKQCTKCSCEHEEENEVPPRVAEKQKKKKENLQTALKVWHAWEIVWWLKTNTRIRYS